MPTQLHNSWQVLSAGGDNPAHVDTLRPFDLLSGQIAASTSYLLARLELCVYGRIMRLSQLSHCHVLAQVTRNNPQLQHSAQLIG
jgi:hypothetical protein